MKEFETNDQADNKTVSENKATTTDAQSAGENAAVKVTLPENPLYEVDVHMDTAVLYDYMLRHTYTTPMGLTATLLGILAIMVYFAKGVSALYLIMGIIMIVYLPWNLFLSARRQALTNEAFKKPLHYAFAEDGVYISQDDTVQMQSWADMKKAISTSKSIVIYTGKASASVFPRKDLGDNVSTLIQIISAHMPPKKVHIRQ